MASNHWKLMDGRTIALLTPEALATLPKGTELFDIEGERALVGFDTIDDDTRGGYLAFREWAAKRELFLDDADVMRWHKRDTPAPVPAVTAAMVVTDAMVEAYHDAWVDEERKHAVPLMVGRSESIRAGLTRALAASRSANSTNPTDL